MLSNGLVIFQSGSWKLQNWRSVSLLSFAQSWNLRHLDSSQTSQKGCATPRYDKRIEIHFPTCNNNVRQAWSNLGFTIILKTRGSDKHTDNCIAHCFKFGLCRATRRPNPTKGRALPDVLRNPPDAHAPPGAPTISLASIDIYAEYAYLQPELNTCRMIQYDAEPLSQLQLPFPFAGCYYPVRANTFEVAAISLIPCEPAMPPAKHYSFLGSHALEQHLPPHVPVDCTSEIMLRLIDFGLRKLIVSPTTKDSQIKVVGENTLKSLSTLAPAVFNPGYREVSLKF